jgi:hypothetical protein
MKYAFLALVVAAFIGMISYMILSRPDPQIIAVDITFINGCPIADHDFVIKDLKSGKYHTFKRGQAKFEVLEGTPLKLALHPSVTKFEYEGTEFSAIAQTTVMSNCGDDDSPSAGFEHLSRELSK